VREFLSVLLASILAASALWSQTSFEVASVKQGAPIPGWPVFFYVMKGGGIETNDPGHFTSWPRCGRNRGWILYPAKVQSRSS